jgi:hypothetical protein
VTLDETVARSIDPRYLALSPARSANSSWVSFLAWRSRRKLQPAADNHFSLTITLIGDRGPIVLYKQLPGMGRAKRYTITIADDNRAPLNKLCGRLIAAGSTCDVPRNGFGRD